MRETIGVISDTHDLLRPEALDALRGSDRIIHAGDICRPEVLDRLARIAPVCAVRGNNDRGPFAAALPPHRTLRSGCHEILIVHDRADLAVNVRADVIVYGHSHKPSLERVDGVLWLNPGSAGPRRFRFPVSLARLDVADDRIDAEIITLWQTEK